MHLLSHFSSGFCIGSLFSISFHKFPKFSFLTLPLLIGFGAMLPDFDGISVFFNHKIFYGSFWYSHHGASHSLFGIIPLTLLFSLIITFFCKKAFHEEFSIPAFTVFTYLYLGNIIHIIEDLPCPMGPWNGLLIFWPLSSRRFGGWGHIWWLNEYLMGIFFIGMLSSFLLLGVMPRLQLIRSRLIKMILSAINLTILYLSFRFVISSKYIDPIQWQNYQKSLLGNCLYSFIRSWNTIIRYIWIREIL